MLARLFSSQENPIFRKVYPGLLCHRCQAVAASFDMLLSNGSRHKRLQIAFPNKLSCLLGNKTINVANHDLIMLKERTNFVLCIRRYWFAFNFNYFGHRECGCNNPQLTSLSGVQSRLTLFMPSSFFVKEGHKAS